MYLYRLLIMQKLLDAKAHLGFCSSYSDTQPYLYGFRNKIAIIDLDKTLICLRRACNVIDLIIRSKGHLLFVNTNPEYNNIVKQTAMRANQSFINHKWIGGFLTNWNHMQNVQQHFATHLAPLSRGPLRSRVSEVAPATHEGPKVRRTNVRSSNVSGLRSKARFAINVTKSSTRSRSEGQLRLGEAFGPRFKKMQKCFEGLNCCATSGPALLTQPSLTSVPDCVIIFNANQNSIAIHEASLLQIPIISLVDSNISNKLHSLITYPIPANHDSVRLIYIVCNCFLKTILLSRRRTGLSFY